MFSLERVGNGDVDLGSVESTVALILFPLATTSILERVQCVFQFGLGNVPCLNISEILLGPGGQLKLEWKAE